MMPINGTIRNSVNLAMMDNKWQQKKKNINMGKEKELTPEEKMIEDYQKQLADIREGKRASDIDAKLASGAELTYEDMEYLKKNNPEALQEYEKSKEEQKQFEKKLKECKSKEDVEKIRTQKLGGFLANAKDIASNSVIPKDKKVTLLGNIQKKMVKIEAAYHKFIKTPKYAKLPDDRKDEKRKKTSPIDEKEDGNQTETGKKQDLSVDAAQSSMDEMRKIMDGFSSDSVEDTSETKDNAEKSDSDSRDGIDLYV